jgi:ArsR family transcriptional regulator
MRKEVSRVIELFKALSEDIRLRILALLIDREMCVCEIEASLKLTQSNASRHLTVLKNSGILDSYKKAQWTYYKIDYSFVMEHSGLWDYLKVKLKEMKTYEADNAEYEKCNENDICANSKKER